MSQNKTTDFPKKVFLCEEENQAWTHKIIENWVLWRRQKWKNNPRVNYLIYRALLCLIVIVLFLFLILIFVFIFINPVVHFDSLGKEFKELCTLENIVHLTFILAGSTSVVYWNMSHTFHKKWLYCAGLYNDIIKKEENKKNSSLKRKMANALAIDLLVLDLWAHRSFSELFSDELKHAIENNNMESSKRSSLKEQMINQEMTEDKAKELLEEYQTQLVTSSISDIPG